MGKPVHLFATLTLALLACVGTLLVLPIGPAKGAATLPPGFTDSQFVSGLTNPTDIEFAPDGRLFVTEDAGRFINDVGENSWEEINQGAAGANYGWPVHEGVAKDPPYVDPIFAYAHGTTDTTGCAITGGTFYPTAALFPQEYEGDYFYLSAPRPCSASLPPGWREMIG
jgi:glucose/arabinose dehydrogenase